MVVDHLREVDPPLEGVERWNPEPQLPCASLGTPSSAWIWPLRLHPILQAGREIFVDGIPESLGDLRCMRQQRRTIFCAMERACEKGLAAASSHL